MPATVKAQRWMFEVVSPGATQIYRIRHASSGRCLQAVSASDGSDVILVDCGTAAQQFWTVVLPRDYPTYGFALRNQRDGRCLDLWYSEDGQPATMWGCDSVYETQLWRIRAGGFDCPERAEIGLCIDEDVPVSGVMLNFRQQPVSFTVPPPGSPSNPGYNDFTNRRASSPASPGSPLRQVDRPDRVRVHRPDTCGACGDSLRRAPVTSVEARQVFDLPKIRIEVVEHRLQHRRCRCGTVTMAAPPAGAGAPTSRGHGSGRSPPTWSATSICPTNGACETLTDLLGVGMSIGTLVAAVTRTSDALTAFLATVRDRIAAAPVAHFD